jgi:hypothetical protein
MRWLLKLYPPAWRERYEEEMAALLEESRSGRRSIIDLLRGAADAWIIGPRGPLGGLEIWLAIVAYGVASVVVIVGRRWLPVAGADWDTVFQILYWLFFIVFVDWVGHQPAAQCDLGGLRSRLRRR